MKFPQTLSAIISGNANFKKEICIQIKSVLEWRLKQKGSNNQRYNQIGRQWRNLELQIHLTITSSVLFFFFPSPVLLCQILTTWAGIFHPRYLSQGTFVLLGFFFCKVQLKSAQLPLRQKSGKTCHLFHIYIQKKKENQEVWRHLTEKSWKLHTYRKDFKFGSTVRLISATCLLLL